jgi:hypothetical protein
MYIYIYREREFIFIFINFLISSFCTQWFILYSLLKHKYLGICSIINAYLYFLPLVSLHDYIIHIFPYNCIVFQNI